jgi:hypothetical protein
MHFAAEDYGRHQLMNWGLCRFAPQSGTTPKATTPYTGDSARPRFVIIGGLLACDQPDVSVGPILADVHRNHSNLQLTTRAVKGKIAFSINALAPTRAI